MRRAFDRARLLGAAFVIGLSFLADAVREFRR